MRFVSLDVKLHVKHKKYPAFNIRIVCSAITSDAAKAAEGKGKRAAAPHLVEAEEYGKVCLSEVKEKKEKLKIMPDERDVAQAKKALEQNQEQGTVAEDVGKHPEHAVQAGKKTPQEHVDKDAIDESGNLIYDDGKDENDAK